MNLPEDKTLSQARRPTVVAHADWSLDGNKRWMAIAVLEDGRYTAYPPHLAGEPSTLLSRLSKIADRGTSVLAGFDFPIGVPALYAERAGIQSFSTLLPRLGRDEWSKFYEVAERPDQIEARRPFYPQRPGGTAMIHLLDGLGVKSKADLLRRCDRGYPGRPAAESIFWTMGPKQVGKAAISGWRDLLAPALRSPDVEVAIWPFDGDLDEILLPGRTVVVETYPAEFYRHFGLRFSSKRSQEDRRSTAPVLLRWAKENDITIIQELRLDLEIGFGTAPDGEDPFDSAIGLLGMLNVVLGNRPTGRPNDPAIANFEGWMFGQLEASDERTTELSTARPRTARLTEAATKKMQIDDTDAKLERDPAVVPAEYDSPADLYDLEYDHDYDVPLWSSLAEREAGPVIEWGAGTGRIAVPLAEAGHDVTAVEVSERMAERGRKKSEGVRWVVGDMGGVDLEQRFGFAVCAFNSFLCLLAVEDALAFLRNAHEHLEPGGLLGIEVSAFTPEELAGEPGGPTIRHDFTRESPDGTLDRFSVSRYDPASQLLSMQLFYEWYGVLGELESKRAHDLDIRVTNRDELTLMLRLAGFEVEAVYGGFEGEPFAAVSDHLIVLARK